MPYIQQHYPIPSHMSAASCDTLGPAFHAKPPNHLGVQLEEPCRILKLWMYRGAGIEQNYLLRKL